MSTLEKAIEKLRSLPKRDQNRFATMLLDEETWNETFGRSASKLDKLGEKVLTDIQAGRFIGFG
jgi:hypothetical protein